MITLSVELAGKASKQVIRFQKAMPQIMRTVYLSAALQAAGEFEKRQLRGRGLAGGMNRPTGRTLAGPLTASAKVNPSVSGGTISGVIGWLDSHAARIASVHEKGTKGAGGTLDDIVPKDGKKALAFKVPFTHVDWFTFKGKKRKKPKVSKITQIIFRKRVAIPPRLKFAETMRNRHVVYATKKAATEAFNKMLEQVFGNG